MQFLFVRLWLFILITKNMMAWVCENKGWIENFDRETCWKAWK
jgi:hypothetical protein